MSEATDEAYIEASAADEGEENVWRYQVTWSGVWESTQKSASYVGEAFTDACAAIEKSFKSGDNAAEVF